jgi:hypothetical protein
MEEGDTDTEIRTSHKPIIGEQAKNFETKLYKWNPKGSDGGVYHSESLGLWDCPSSGIVNTRKHNISETG